jgi:hypothetical protein
MVKVLINKPIFNVKFILQLMTLNHNLQKGQLETGQL